MQKAYPFLVSLAGVLLFYTFVIFMEGRERKRALIIALANNLGQPRGISFSIQRGWLA